jgi:hypothetical protein
MAPFDVAAVSFGALVLAVIVGASVVGGGLGTGTGTGTAREDVRGGFGGFYWATDEPTAPLGPIEPAMADQLVARAAGAIDPDRDDLFGITIVSVFQSAGLAYEQAVAIRRILAETAAWYADPANAAARAQLDDGERSAPLPPPEVEALETQLGAPVGRGIGWGGSVGAAGDAVFTFGPILFVTGLKSEGADVFDLPIHPLVQLLRKAGGQVIVEGDRFGEGAIIADLSCQVPDPAGGTRILDELGDAMLTAGQFDTRPPWIGPPPTAAEALARATFRRWQEASMRVMERGRMRDLIQRLATADITEREQVMREFEAELVKAGLEEIDGPIDPEVLSLMAEGGLDTSDAGRAAWTRAVADRMGRLSVEATAYGDAPAPDDYERLLFAGSLRLRGTRLDLGALSFGRAAAGLPSLAGYLDGRGCIDLRFAVVDFEAGLEEPKP